MPLNKDDPGQLVGGGVRACVVAPLLLPWADFFVVGSVTVLIGG